MIKTINMIKVMKKVLKKIFPETIKSIELDENYRSRKVLGEEISDENHKIRSFEIERLCSVGPVIVLCNEWQNPVIGKITYVEEMVSGFSCVYHVYDYLTQSTMQSSNTPIAFTMQKLKAFAKLTPDDICALYFEGKSTFNEIYKDRSNVNTEENIIYTGYEDWIERLIKTGFFKDFPKYTSK